MAEEKITNRPGASVAPVRRHARDFLNFADPETAAIDLLETALRSAVRDRAGRRTLRRVEQWTIAQLELLGVEPDQALESDDLLDLVAAARLVAIRLPVGTRRRSARRLRDRAALRLDQLEHDFVPELLKETRRRIADNPTFAADIADSREAVPNLLQRLDTLRGEVAATVPEDDPDVPEVLQNVILFTVLLIALLVTGTMVVMDDELYEEKESDDDE
jgi:hypothetical protein